MLAESPTSTTVVSDRGRWWRRWHAAPRGIQTALTLLFAALILIARRPDIVRHPQFWAEDGTVFFHDAYVYGCRALLQPYAGYLHTAPRLIAAAALQFDPAVVPTLFVAGAFLLTLYVVARTQSARCPLPRSVLAGLAVVLVPDTYEILLFLANIQWITTAILLLLLISADAERWWQHLHDATAAFIFGLTGPFSVLLTPLFVWRAWRRRTAASILLALIVVAAGGVQAVSIWLDGANSASGAAFDHLLAVPGMRVGGSLFLGTLVRANFPNSFATTLGILTLAAVAVLSLNPGPHRTARIGLGFAFAALLAATLVRCRQVLPELCQPGYGSRYFFPLQLAVMWLIIAATTDQRRWVARVASVACLWILAINAPRLREPALAEMRWSSYVDPIRRGDSVTIKINPRPWEFTLPPRPR